MALQQQTQHVAPYDRWNQALLDVLLPILPEDRRGTPVLLACDEGRVAAAGATLGLTPAESVRKLGAVVEQRYRLATDGTTDGVRRSAVQFNNSADRAHLVPPFLPVCAVMVLAASTMTAAEGMSTSNYYKRLWETLGTQPRRRPPYEFEYAPWLFKHLARWLAADLDGARGVLMLEESGPVYIGCAINQCLFRQRDKEHLHDFFAHRVHGTGAGANLLRLLQVSSDRHYLTHRAQSVIADPNLQPLARLALEQVFADWDGTVADAHGGRSFVGTLHLAVNRRLALSVSAAPSPAGQTMTTSEMTEMRLPVSLDCLNELAKSGLRLGERGQPGVVLRPTGETLVFEVTEDAGLVSVKAPTQPTLYVLSRDQELQRVLADYLADGLGVADLPRAWRLFERVPVERLPAAVSPQAAAGRQAVALAGGLRMGSGWLVGFPPRVEVGDVDETLTVVVDGEHVGDVAGGGEFSLDLAEGDHRVEVGDGLDSFLVHMLARNPLSPPFGQLACSLDARGLRTGASDRPRTPFVCGAVLDEPRGDPLPLLFRGRTVWLITADGVGLRECAPASPQWLSRVGLDADAARWELEVEDDIAWVLAGHTALMLGPGVPAQLDRAACNAISAMGDHPRVRGLAVGDSQAAALAFIRLREIARPPADAAA